jgi:hypothetical protein
MEPDDYNFEIDWKSYKKYTIMDNGTTSYRHMDLSSVSTRDLLNECYRRRAIEKFSATSHVDEFMLDRDVTIMKYIRRDVEDGIWRSVLENTNFAEQAIKIVDSGNRHMRSPGIMREVLGEVYVCKHPESLRK